MWFQTKEGRPEAFQPHLMASGQSKEVSRKVLGGYGEKRDLRRRKEKAAPLDKGMGEDMGKALHSLPNAHFRGEQRGLQSMLRPRVVVESGERTMARNGGVI